MNTIARLFAFAFHGLFACITSSKVKGTKLFFLFHTKLTYSLHLHTTQQVSEQLSICYLPTFPPSHPSPSRHLSMSLFSLSNFSHPSTKTGWLARSSVRHGRRMGGKRRNNCLPVLSSLSFHRQHQHLHCIRIRLDILTSSFFIAD